MEDMVDDGFQDIIGCDISRVVIDGMKIRYVKYFKFITFILILIDVMIILKLNFLLEICKILIFQKIHLIVLLIKVY